MVFRGGAFGKQLGYVWSPMKGIIALRGRNMTEMLSLSTKGYSEDVCKPGQGPSSGTKLTRTLILRFHSFCNHEK
jgi:hypothetical protein